MTPEQIADRAIADRKTREQQFEEAARAVGLVNDYDLHRDESGAYSMLNTRKLCALYLTGVAVAQADEETADMLGIEKGADYVQLYLGN